MILLMLRRINESSTHHALKRGIDEPKRIKTYIDEIVMRAESGKSETTL